MVINETTLQKDWNQIVVSTDETIDYPGYGKFTGEITNGWAIFIKEDKEFCANEQMISQMINNLKGCRYCETVIENYSNALKAVQEWMRDKKLPLECPSCSM